MLIKGYQKEYNNNHVEFTINQIEKWLSTIDNYINETNDYNSGNTYLHEVCSITLRGGLFCVELFEYFLSKGLTTADKNIEGQTCLDVINKEHLEKALTAVDLFCCKGIGLK